jgi:AraC family transcriptional regulator
VQRTAERLRIEARDIGGQIAEHPPRGLLLGTGKVTRTWSTVSVAYAWGQPYCSPARAKPNRVEIIFSAHPRIEVEVDGKPVDVEVPPGGSFVLGSQKVDFLRRREFGDWLEVRVTDSVKDAFRRWHPSHRDDVSPTFNGKRKVALAPNLQVVSLAHVFRRACLRTVSLSDIEADSLAHLFVAAALGAPPTKARHNPLTPLKLNRVFEFVEQNLEEKILLSEMAAVAVMSPFHFTRLFKQRTGLAPHQYVMTRRLERAKQMLTKTLIPVREICWALGIDNLSHFRRKFTHEFGVRPTEIRYRKQPD